jgi:hypothetical protein
MTIFFFKKRFIKKKTTELELESRKNSTAWIKAHEA